MATKLYVDGLRLVLKHAHRYATRWQSQLQGNLTDTQYDCLLDFIQAAATCLAALGPNIITP